MEILTLGLEPRLFAWLSFGVAFGIVLLVGIVNLIRIRLNGLAPDAANDRALRFNMFFTMSGIFVLMPGAVTLAVSIFGNPIAPDQVLFGWLAVAAGVFAFLFGIGFGTLLTHVAEKSGDPEESTSKSELDAVS